MKNLLNILICSITQSAVLYIKFFVKIAHTVLPRTATILQRNYKKLSKNEQISCIPSLGHFRLKAGKYISSFLCFTAHPSATQPLAQCYPFVTVWEFSLTGKARLVWVLRKRGFFVFRSGFVLTVRRGRRTPQSVWVLRKKRIFSFFARGLF